MVSSHKTAIIVQARTGSTRLPHKMTIPFFEDESLLSLLLKRLRADAQGISIIVATTSEVEDNEIENLCRELSIDCFRGSAEDVLDRFIQCAEDFKVETIIRVCADNPFFDLNSTLTLCKHLTGNSLDYVGFDMGNGLPSIKTHIGLWGEAVSLDALKRVGELTQEKLYREHVTNYIYSHPDKFNLELIDVPFQLKGRTDLRFTLDTKADFELHQHTYSYYKRHGDVTSLIKFVDNHPEYLEIMRGQIELNSK